MSAFFFPLSDFAFLLAVRLLVNDTEKRIPQADISTPLQILFRLCYKSAFDLLLVLDFDPLPIPLSSLLFMTNTEIHGHVSMSNALAFY